MEPRCWSGVLYLSIRDQNGTAPAPEKQEPKEDLEKDAITKVMEQEVEEDTPTAQEGTVSA